MNPISHFPCHIEATAFRNREEYAWQREDLDALFAYCRASSIAIVAGEAWVVRRLAELQAHEPSEHLHNLDPHKHERGSVLARTMNHVIYGIVPLRTGESGVLSWSNSSQTTTDSWQAYVERSIEETRELIERIHFEAAVIPEYAEHVYYNLMFEREDGSYF